MLDQPFAVCCLLFADEQNKKQEEEQLQVEGEEDQDSDIFWL